MRKRGQKCTAASRKYVKNFLYKIGHFDFYRINSLAEAFDMGYEEYFYSGDLCLVEWPEKIEGLLPDDVMVVRIEPLDETSRRFTMQ